jgi:hypothetical protein
MSLVSPQKVTFNKNIESSDINTPIEQLANVINGNLDESNIKNGSITPEKLALNAGNSWVWQTWTPTWLGCVTAIGNATVVAKYTQIGKTVVCRIKFTQGSSTTLVGNAAPITFSLPVNANSESISHTCGSAYIENSTVAGYQGLFQISGTGTVSLLTGIVNGTYLQNTGCSTNVPFDWGANDFFQGYFTYEAS